MWRGKQHPHSRGRSVAKLFAAFIIAALQMCLATVVKELLGLEQTWLVDVSSLAEPAMALCCAEAWTGLVLGQGKHHPQAPPNLPMDLDGFFLPTVQAAPCPPQLTVARYTPLAFTLVPTLKENSLLRSTLSCALLFWKAVFPLAKSTRVVPRGHVGVSSSFWPLPRGCRPPSPCSGGGSPACHPAPAASCSCLR